MRSAATPSCSLLVGSQFGEMTLFIVENYEKLVKLPVSLSLQYFDAHPIILTNFPFPITISVTDISVKNRAL